jgi:hypothetical protein
VKSHPLNILLFIVELAGCVTVLAGEQRSVLEPQRIMCNTSRHAFGLTEDRQLLMRAIGAHEDPRLAMKTSNPRFEWKLIGSMGSLSDFACGSPTSPVPGAFPRPPAEIQRLEANRVNAYIRAAVAQETKVQKQFNFSDAQAKDAFERAWKLYLVELKRLIKHFDYLVYVVPNKGGGDIVFASKTANAIAEKTDKAVGLFLDENGRYTGDFNLEGSLDQEIVTVRSKSGDGYSADVVIVAPYTTATDITLKRNRTITLSEYNIHNKGTFKGALIPTGIGADIYRISHEPKLAGIYWLSEKEIATVRHTRIEFPHVRPEELAFLRNGDYYFAYSSSGEFKCELLMGLQSEIADSNLRVVMPGGRGQIEAMVQFLRDTEEFRGQLKLVNLKDSSTEIVTFADSPKSTTIFYGALDHKVFLKLMDQSIYPFVQVTGDQSLAEALSLGKVPLYESLAHKQYVIRGIANWAKMLGYQDLYTTLIAGNMGADIFPVLRAPKIPPMRTFLTGLNNPAIRDSYSLFLAGIRKDFDLKKTLWRILGLYP